MNGIGNQNSVCYGRGAVFGCALEAEAGVCVVDCGYWLGCDCGFWLGLLSVLYKTASVLFCSAVLVFYFAAFLSVLFSVLGNSWGVGLFEGFSGMSVTFVLLFFSPRVCCASCTLSTSIKFAVSKI